MKNGDKFKKKPWQQTEVYFMPWAKDIDNRIKEGKVVWLGKQKMKAGLKLNKKSCKTVIISAPPPTPYLLEYQL